MVHLDLRAIGNCWMALFSHDHMQTSEMTSWRWGREWLKGRKIGDVKIGHEFLWVRGHVSMRRQAAWSPELVGR